MAIIITSKRDTRIFFPIEKTLRKIVPKSTRKYKRNVLIHAPWASYNTPQIELIQYCLRIRKKVYCNYKLHQYTKMV